MPSVQLFSPLAKEVCLRRISNTTDRFWSYVLQRECNPILGWIKGDHITLCKRLSYQNALQTFMYAELKEHEVGTIIKAQFTLNRLVQFFLLLWFGMPCVAFVIALATGVPLQLGDYRGWLLLSAGVVVVVGGRWIARTEKAFLIDYLQHTLDAKSYSELPAMPNRTPSDIYPCLTYTNAPAAIDWLCRVFGFSKQLVVDGPNDTVRHSELSLGTGVIMVCSPRPDENRFGPPPNGTSLLSLSAYVADPDARHQHAVAAGARIVQPPHDTEFGARLYVVEDLEGYHWCFGNYRPGQYWAKSQQ